MGTSAYLLRKYAPAVVACRIRGDGGENFVELAVPASPVPGGAGNGTSAYLLRKSAPAAVGRPGPRTCTGTAGWTRHSRGPPHSMERATGRLRICFANPHRLQAPAGAFACSLQTLRVCFTLAPWRVRVPALSSKKHGNVALPCLCIFLERATGLEPASVSLGS